MEAAAKQLSLSWSLLLLLLEDADRCCYCFDHGTLVDCWCCAGLNQ